MASTQLFQTNNSFHCRYYCRNRFIIIGLLSDKTPSGNLMVISGPLRVYLSNTRYFTDLNSKAVYLTGSHTWGNFKDSGPGDSYTSFDFDGYLDFLQSHNHNFMRLWTWELPKSDCGEGIRVASPFPWPRTGPGTASDGKLRFDLSRFDQPYLDRLRSRILRARERGIYVSIMLFEGYGLQFCRFPQDGFPFSEGNNVNGIKASEVSYLTLADRRVTSLQEAYVRKVIDTVNDLDNVVYEISNESPATLENTSWQYHLIDYIHHYETKKPMRHPVLMSCQWSSGQNNNEVLFKSPAEAISPAWGGHGQGSVDDYRSDPPAADGGKVVISDTDHLWGIGGDHQWVWKSFLRGLNPIFLDPYSAREHQNHPSKCEWELIRKNMGKLSNHEGTTMTLLKEM